MGWWMVNGALGFRIRKSFHITVHSVFAVSGGFVDFLVNQTSPCTKYLNKGS